MAEINVIKIKGKPIVIHYRAFEKCFRMQYILPHAGAAYEDIPGLAHAIEHMLVFNAIGDHNTVNAMATNVGVKINAFTGFAMAGLDASGIVSLEALDEVARQWTAQLKTENYTQQNWDREREVIRAEALDADNTAAFIDVTMRAATRQLPRYKQGVMIGSDYLDYITVADLKRAHKKWGVWGDQSFVLIVGDLTTDEIEDFMKKTDFGKYDPKIKMHLDKNKAKAYCNQIVTWKLSDYSLSGIEARRFHFMEASGPIVGTQAWYDALAIGEIFFTGNSSRAHEVLRSNHGICYDCNGIISRVDGGILLGIEYAMERKPEAMTKSHKLLANIVKDAVKTITPEVVKMASMSMKTTYCLTHNSIDSLTDGLSNELVIMSYESTPAQFEANAKLLTLENRIKMLDNLNYNRLQRMAKRFAKSKYTVHYFIEKR